MKDTKEEEEDHCPYPEIHFRKTKSQYGVSYNFKRYSYAMNAESQYFTVPIRRKETSSSHGSVARVKTGHTAFHS